MTTPEYQVRPDLMTMNTVMIEEQIVVLTQTKSSSIPNGTASRQKGRILSKIGFIMCC